MSKDERRASIKNVAEAPWRQSGVVDLVFIVATSPVTDDPI
jgi:hypothetical protein